MSGTDFPAIDPSIPKPKPTPTPDATAIPIPWGRRGGGDADGQESATVLELAVPAPWRVADVTDPDLEGVLGDYPSALERVLDHPEVSLESRVGPQSRVAIVIDDPSRWTPADVAVPAVLARLRRAGVPLDRVDLCIAVGRHRAVDEATLRRRLGDEVLQSLRWHSPPVDNRSAYAHLGRTSQGVPVWVFKPVASADVRILIGSVLPHLQAGFGGGEKLIFPGSSHRLTLGALHRQGIGPRQDASRLLGSDADENPMRQTTREALALLSGETISISHVLGASDQVLRVEGGSPLRVQNLLAHEARRRFQAPFRPPANMVVVGNWPWPGDPLQSFKVLLNHRAACAPGGILAGLFWTDPCEIDRSLRLSALKLVARLGTWGDPLMRKLVANAERMSQMLHLSSTFMLRWARELVVDRMVVVYCPPLYQRLGPHLGPVRLFDRLDEMWTFAYRHLSHTVAAEENRLRVRIFPRGGLTYCRQRPPQSGSGSGSGPGASRTAAIAINNLVPKTKSASGTNAASAGSGSNHMINSDAEGILNIWDEDETAASYYDSDTTETSDDAVQDEELTEKNAERCRQNERPDDVGRNRGECEGECEGEGDGTASASASGSPRDRDGI